MNQSENTIINPHKQTIEQKIAELGLVSVADADLMIYTVRGSKGTTYTVDLTKGTCTCPDFVYRQSKLSPMGKCKHIVAVESESFINPPKSPIPKLCACGQEATYDYCAVDMCESCFKGRIAQNAQTHVSGMI